MITILFKKLANGNYVGNYSPEELTAEHVAEALRQCNNYLAGFGRLFYDRYGNVCAPFAALPGGISEREYLDYFSSDTFVGDGKILYDELGRPGLAITTFWPNKNQSNYGE